ncbi:fibroblast growth factor binding protein 1 S homeolog precursor [Xenopus laevis]|uniref:Fibroblast growth factor binding protein 1 S homeolog precursor n=1 Tax=Xenopus laevis TaxID=8355 RepID=Q640W8_XENLA|nr:fibroblast growth factor binding protein 1 S homeolog precursor [Xenopus laevis]AAH82471.1 MGC84401 protein [Xenopus laevis]
MKLAHIAFLGIVTLLVSDILLVEGNKEREGKKERGKTKGDKKTEADAPQGKGGRSKGGKGSHQGKFVSKENANCTWAVTETQSVALKIDCKKEGSSFSCTFGGNPASCPKYTGNEKSYWKQISRALKKQKKICQDPKAVLKSKECKKGPQEAHLRYLSSDSLVPENTEKEPAVQVKEMEAGKDCEEDADPAERQRIVAEYCGHSWGSFCNFFLSMLQSKSC